MQKEQHLLAGQESNFLSVLTLVRRIATIKLRGAHRDEAEDIIQKVSLNLWRWGVRRKQTTTETQPNLKDSVLNRSNKEIDEKILSQPVNSDELSQDEWMRLANTAAHNEISSFFRSKYRRESILNEASLENAARELSTQRKASAYNLNPEGNSKVEITSLLQQIWKIVQTFSLRQKYAFLLQKEELIVSLLTHGCCRRKEIAEILDLDKTEFDKIFISLPLNDEAICNLFEEKSGTQLTLRQIWMARGKAKTKLASELKHLI